MATACTCLLFNVPKRYIEKFSISRDYGGSTPGFTSNSLLNSKRLQRTDATPCCPPSGRRKFRFANCFRAHFGPGEPRLSSLKTRTWAAAPTGLSKGLLHPKWERVGWGGTLPVSARPQTKETATHAHCGPWFRLLKFHWQNSGTVSLRRAPGARSTTWR